MKRIKGENYGKNFLDKARIWDIEENENLVHIGTKVIKDEDLAGLLTIQVDDFLANDNEDIILIPFSHPDTDKYEYSVCEIFIRKALN